MRKYDYSKEDVENAVSKSLSLAQAMINIGMNSKGRYCAMKRLIRKFNVDTSHFRGQSHNKGKIFGFKNPIETYFSGKKKISSNGLKQRLILENIKKHQCEKCSLTTWNGLKIPITLHHLDGNTENNQLKNLQILCPNCHSQTDSFCGKNIKTKLQRATRVGRTAETHRSIRSRTKGNF